MQRNVIAVVEFIEGPSVCAERTMSAAEVLECLKESDESGTLIDFGIAPNALLKHAVQHASTSVSTAPIRESVEAWLSVRCLLAWSSMVPVCVGRWHLPACRSVPVARTPVVVVVAVLREL